MVVFKGRAWGGGSPLRLVLAHVHLGGPRGGSFLTGVSMVSPPVSGGGSGLVLGPAGGGGIEVWGWVSSVS